MPANLRPADTESASNGIPDFEVAVIIVSFNTRDLTLASIHSVLEQTPSMSLEILVVDNGSTDGSAEAIEAEFGDRVRLICSKENLGFAGANNLAAGHAVAPLILLLNPDTLIRDEALERLVAFASSRPEARIWGGKTVFPDGALNPSSCWRRISAWALLCRATGLAGLFPDSPLFNTEAYGGWARDCVREVDIISGCFLLIERSLWEELCGFDPVFFMYGEEADLCLRARQFGARPTVTPDATIVHYGGASEKVRSDKLVRLLRAKCELARRHMQLPGIGLLLLAAWPLSRLIALSTLGMLRPSESSAESRAVWEEVWRRRREWQQPASASKG